MTVDLDPVLGLSLGEDLLVHEELADLGPLVALELNNLARLVVDDGAVAGELLQGTTVYGDAWSVMWSIQQQQQNARRATDLFEGLDNLLRVKL